MAPINSGFVAQYPGRCFDCRQDILPGDSVRYDVNDDLVHAYHRAAPERPVTICQSCWLTMPCECDA